jgi:hypothetical protein
VTPIYKLSDNSILNGRIIYSSMLAGNAAFDPNLTVDYLVVAGGGARLGEPLDFYILVEAVEVDLGQVVAVMVVVPLLKPHYL